jgi:hypothetical protein
MGLAASAISYSGMASANRATRASPDNPKDLCANARENWPLT